jgi:hypothetical protein
VALSAPTRAQPAASPPELKSGTASAARPGGEPDRPGEKTSSARLAKEEIGTVLPLFLESPEARRLAAVLEVLLRRGDTRSARGLLDGFIDASTFAVLAADWVDEPDLLRMLHARGIQGDDRSQSSEVAGAAQVRELEAALQRERERAEALVEKLARLEASREHPVGGTAGVGEGQGARPHERPEAVAHFAALTERPATVDSTQSTTSSPSAAGSPASSKSGSARPGASESAAARGASDGKAPSDNPLLRRADTLLRAGDVSGARLLLERASDEGDARATLLLAETFDPAALSKLRVVGVRGDPVKAQELRDRVRGMAPPEFLELCRERIADEARPRGATRVEAVSAGPPHRLPNGGFEAPIKATVTYARESQLEVRVARINCRLDGGGRVLELL